MAIRLEPEWEMEDYLRALWLHRWFIAAVSFVFTALMLVHIIQQPNIYRATARVLIETQPPQVVQFQDITPYAGGVWSQTFLQTEHQVIASRPTIARVVEELHLAAFPPFSQAKDPVEMLRKMISVEPVRATKLVDIRATGTRPELVARIANTLADTYARLNLERRKEMTTGGAQWLRDEVLKMEEKMRNAQLALQAFLEQHGTVDFGEEQQNTVLQRLRDLNTAITLTRKNRIEAEAKYREKHPTLLELQAKEKELQLALFDQEQRALEMSRLSIQYNALLREAKTNESIYNILLTRLKELSVQEGLQANNVRVIEYARLPEVPIGPPRIRLTLLATLFGLVAGGGLATLAERLTKTLQTRRDFERLLEIPFLGYVPLVKLGRRKQGDGENFILMSGPKSTVAETIRTIRTTLEFLLPSGQSYTLLMTSSLPEEGKSLICVNLAMALQELGRKVLVIDGDLRRPNLHRLLKLNLEPGLSGYLQEKVGMEDLVQRAVPANNLAVVPAGLTPPQPTDLLSSPRLRELLDLWKKDYQYILIDAPPVLVAADAAALATNVDRVIFLVRAGCTHGEIALTAKQRLVDVGAQVIGGILNGVRVELERGYKYYYYYNEGKRSFREQGSVPKTPTP